VTKNIELFAMGRNIFDNHYASFGQMGQNFFQNNQTTTFMGPGAPATGYAGIRVHWN
jgi:iron complex outermembrane receptor protein